MFQTRFWASVCFLSLCLPAWARNPNESASPEGPDYQVQRVNGERYQLKVAGRPVVTSERPIEDVRVVSLGDSKTQIAAWSEKTRDADFRFYSIKPASREWRRSRKADYAVLFKSGPFQPVKGEAQKIPERLAVKAERNTPQLYCVQFYTPSLPAYRLMLENLGGDVLDYVPNYCYMIRMTPENAEKVKELDAVRWADLLHPYYKVGKDLLQEESRRFEGKKRFNLYATSEADRKVLAGQIQKLAAEFDSYRGQRTVPAELTAEQLAELLKSPLVQWVEFWQPIGEDMNNARIQGGADFIESASTLPAGYTGAGIRGHVLDGGVQPSHNDFAANSHRGLPIAVSDNGISNLHGQATFGIIFGSGASDPIGQARGILPNAQGLYTNKRTLTGPAGGTGAGTRYELVGRLVAEKDVMFQAASWGNGHETDYTAHSAEMDRIIFDHDISITQSQGNTESQLSRAEAWAKNIISVGGVHHGDNSNPADDSWQSGNASIGPASDGRKKPDLCAYNDSIRTTSLNAHQDFSGTSGATPIVAGHLGLVLEMWTNGDLGNSLKAPGGTRFENRPHFTTAKALLIASARQYDFNSSSTNNRREHQGWGFPNVRRLYECREKLLVVDESDVLSLTGEAEKTYQVNVAAGEPVLKICMTFADPPGSPSAVNARINDLTLRVVAPNGDVYWGNHGLDANRFSTPGGSADAVDTVECVFVENPAAGLWSVTVTAEEINADGHPETAELDADFALVVLGITKPKLCPRGPVN